MPLSNVNSHDKENKTALYYALENCNIEQLEGKALLELSLELIKMMDIEAIELWTINPRTNIWCMACEKKLEIIVEAILQKS